MARIGDAEIVIIGGGAVGMSIAYHLAARGRSDAAPLEPAEVPPKAYVAGSPPPSRPSPV